MTAALDRVSAVSGNANVKAFLMVIRTGESSTEDSAYTMEYGGTHFVAPPWRHPFYGIPTTEGGKACGAYQFLGTTFARCSDDLGLDGDFSPVSQDIAAVYLIDSAGALSDVVQGNLLHAAARLEPTWVSLRWAISTQAAANVFKQYGGTWRVA